MHIFISFAILFLVDSKITKFQNSENTKNHKTFLESLGGLNLNEMVGKNGILNQQGSILQMAFKQNGEYFRPYHFILTNNLCGINYTIDC